MRNAVPLIIQGLADVVVVAVKHLIIREKSEGPLGHAEENI